jgi:hypothetical protein
LAFFKLKYASFFFGSQVHPTTWLMPSAEETGCFDI